MVLVFPGKQSINENKIHKNFKLGSTKHRLSIIRLVQTHFKNHSVDARTVNKLFILLSKIGSASNWGNVYLVCLRGSNGCEEKMPFALKIQNPINHHTDACEPLRKNDLNTELLFLKISNYLVMWRVCVHFPITPLLFILPKKKLVRRGSANSSTFNAISDKKCDLVGILTEWANQGDVKTWTRHGISFDKGIQLVVQIMMAIYTLNYIIGYHHNDLHDGNILISDLETPKTFLYKVYYGKKLIDIRIHNCSFISRLWDFSYANTVHIHRLSAYKNNKNIRWRSDTDQILKIMGSSVQYRTLHQVIAKLQQIHLQHKSFLDYFNYSMYFLATQSSSVTINQQLQSNNKEIVSILKPLTKTQKNILYKSRIDEY